MPSRATLEGMATSSNGVAGVIDDTGRELGRGPAFGQNHADPVASAWDPVAATASRL